MPKFQDPPLRTEFHKEAPTKQKPGGILNEGWQRHFIAITNRLTQPNIPVVTSAPTTGKAGDLRTDGSFLYVCVQDTPTVVYKKVALT